MGFSSFWLHFWLHFWSADCASAGREASPITPAGRVDASDAEHRPAKPCGLRVLPVGAGHQVAVAVVGGCDRGMAEVGLERLCVLAGGNHQARISVAAVVERDGTDALRLPVASCALVDRACVERAVTANAAQVFEDGFVQQLSLIHI